MTAFASDNPIVVLGAAGAVGRLVTSVLAGANCQLFDLIEDRERGITGADATDEIVRESVAACSAVIICLPDSAATAALNTWGRQLSPDQLLVDTLSIKGSFLAQSRDLGLDCQQVSINPMFAPDLDPTGRPIAVITVRMGDKASEFVDLLTGTGAQLIPISDVSGNEHDKVTAALQVATHASVLSFGLTLAALGYQASDARDLWTPPHQTLLALLARVGTLSPEVYRDIQHEHPLAESVRCAARDALTEIGTATSQEAFAALVERALEPLGDSQDDLATLCADLFSRRP